MKSTNLIILIVIFVTLLFFVLANKQLFPPTKKVTQVKNHVSINPPSKKDQLYVTQVGTQLMLEGKTIRISGVNDYDLAYKDNAVIDQTFAQLHSAGVNTIRFWLFGDGTPEGFQPQPGVMNEARFKQADYIFSVARKYQIKLIPVLVNNWTDYGGKNQYIKWIGGNPATNESVFYTDSHAKALFGRYLSYVLSRKNTYTNVIYAKDTTILGWDIMNEPRSENQLAMNDWLVATAQEIKKLDHNHLVFAGTEAAITPAHEQEQASQLCQNKIIALCSVHLYLVNATSGEKIYANASKVTQFLDEQQRFAKKNNKPIIIEEFGVDAATRPFGNDPFSELKQIINFAKEKQYAGFLIWHWSDKPDSGYTFSPHGDIVGGYSLSDLQRLLH